MDFTAPFFFCAKLYPRRPALMWIGGGVSYALLADNVLAAAGHLAKAGLRRGDLAAIDIDSAYHHTVVMLALMHLGIGSASLEAGRRAAAEAGGVKFIICDHTVAEGGSRIIRVHEDWFASGSASAPLPETGFHNLDDIYRIKFTSGTTGRPQPIPMSLRDGLQDLEETRYFDVEGRTLSMFGISSGLGTRVIVRALHTGGTICIASNSQDAYDTIQLCNVERVLASTMQLRDLTARAREAGEPLHSLKSVLTGGSSISARLIANAQRWVCNNLIVQYASTQAGLVALAPATALEGRPGAAGFIVPQTEVECIGEDGQPLPPGQTGELRIRTSGSALRQGLATDGDAAGFRDGWFYPGDVGRIDPDGMLIIAGRKSEIVNIGGVKIAPDLVDDVLTGLPGVSDGAAFGIRNRHDEEELWAAIVCDGEPDIPALLAACRTELGSAAPSILLRAIAIPRNAAGKVLRQKLRQDVEALAGGKPSA